MKILISGSNKNGNDKAKEQAIATLRKAELEVADTKSLYRSTEDKEAAIKKIDDALKACDIFYIICSDKGYIGENTLFRLGMAAGLGDKIVCTSEPISTPDLQDYLPQLITDICSPDEMVQQILIHTN